MAALGMSSYALVSCLAGENDTAAVRVDPDRETRLQVPNGPLIVLPAGSTSGPGELVAEKLSETPALPEEVVSVTDGGWDIHLEDTELVGTARLRFPVRAPDDVPPDVVDVMLTFYDQQQRQWVPVESRYDRRQQTVTATVEHLSWWNPVTWDYRGLLTAATTSFADFATAPETDQPQCPKEDQARADGTRVVSDGGSRIKWCYGASDTGRLLRLTNGRAYPALVSYPSGWNLQRQRSDSLAQAIGARVIEQVTTLPDDRSGILLDGGQLVTLYPEQEPGSTAFVGVKSSSGGYILGGLEYAGSTVEFVGSKIPGAGLATASSAIDFSSCIPELADTSGAAAVDQAAGGLGPELVEKSLLCVARQAVVSTVYEEFFFSAIEWLADGSQRIVAGAGGIADSLRVPYRIAITVPAGDQSQQSETTTATDRGSLEQSSDDTSCGTVTWQQYDLEYYVYQSDETCEEALRVAQDYFNESPPLDNAYGAVLVGEWGCDAKEQEEPYFHCSQYEGGGDLTFERVEGQETALQEAGESWERAIPQGFVGDWSGVVNRGDDLTYRLNLSIESGIVGEKVGTSYYPNENCRGDLELDLVSDNSIVLHEDITSVDSSNSRTCPYLSSRRIPLRLLSDDTVRLGLETDPDEEKGVLTR